MLLASSMVSALALSVALPGGEPQELSVSEESVALQVGEKSLSVQLSMFDMDDSGDGNPFLDESLTVIGAVVVFDQQLTERLGIATELAYDDISSASIDRLSEFPAHSGASGDYYAGADVSFRYALSDRVDLGAHVGGSTEFDYESIGIGAGIAIEAPDKASSWSFSVDAFFDSVDVIRFDATDEPSEDRTSVAGTIGHYRILGRKTHADMGLTVSNQSGFLESPYNAVVLEDPLLPPNPNLENNARGTEITEELPGSRTRSALYGRVRHLLEPGRSVELGGRLYADSWGVESLAVHPRLYQSLGDEVLLRLGYRYYAQSAADDYDGEFLAADPTPRHRTQDSALAQFHSNTLGARIDWSISPSSSWNVGLNYVMRSDGLDQVLLALGWQTRF